VSTPAGATREIATNAVDRTGDVARARCDRMAFDCPYAQTEPGLPVQEVAMVRVLATVVSLCLAAPALADAPGKGSFGTGVSLQGFPIFNANNIATIENGINVRYFLTNNFLLFGAFGVTTTENVGTQFTVGGGTNYYFRSGRDQQFAPFLGGSVMMVANSPSGADSRVGVLVLTGGGLEYWFNRHFGASVMEGLQFLGIKDATSFAMVTRLGLNFYF
jgi:hypothetical protein